MKSRPDVGKEPLQHLLIGLHAFTRYDLTARHIDPVK